METNTSPITQVSTLKGVLDARVSEQYVSVKHSGLLFIPGTFDTYSVPPGYEFLGQHESVQVCEILNVQDDDIDEDIDGNKVDNHMSASLIKNVPVWYEREEWDEDDSYPQGGVWVQVANLYRMAGQVTFPADGSDRDSNIIFGIFEDSQLVGKGIKMTDAGGDAAVSSGYSLAAYALAARHEAYRAWLAKDRQVISVGLDLNLQDIANFRFWHAVMIRSRKFIVKRLTLRLSAKRDGILASAELISM